MEVNGIYEGLGGDPYATRCCDLGQEFARSNLRISELDVWIGIVAPGVWTSQ